VLVDGKPRSKSFGLAGGEMLEADLAPPPLEPEAGGVVIRHRDPYLIVVSKPAGLASHPTASRRTGTLVNQLLGMGIALPETDSPGRPGIVHRLDVGTSGLMVVATDAGSVGPLSELFRRHLVDRRYGALVRGRPTHERFVVDAPLERRRARIVVRPATGRRAETEVEVKERLRRSALVEARPRTGRTHQIRVHLAAIGHPILGDRAYGGAGQDATALHLDRPFLHSWWIGFAHPITGERIELEDSLPPDLASALDLARRG
jgi:23S rRNA pseudouridine1911/1915/1917 synthase